MTNIVNFLSTVVEISSLTTLGVSEFGCHQPDVSRFWVPPDHVYLKVIFHSS